LTERKPHSGNSRLHTPPVLNQQPIGVILPEPLLEFTSGGESRPTVAFRSEHIGEGNPVLGDQLMAQFLEALLAHPEPPLAMLFYNSAVYLTLDDSPVLDTLRKLADRGCEMLVCKTSLQMLSPGRPPAVGRPAAMAELTDRMRQARQMLWP